MRTARARNAPWASLAAAAAGAVVICVYYRLAGSPVVQSSIYDAIGLTSVAAVVVGILVNRPRRRGAWVLLAVGFGLFAAGDTMWTVEFDVLGRAVPVLTHSDILYLSGYAVLVLALTGLCAGASREWDEVLATMVDALLAAVTAAVLAWAFLIDPVISNGLSFSEQVVSAAYPTLDVLLLVLVIGVVRRVGLRSVPAVLLVIGFALQLAGDGLWRDVSIYTAYTPDDWINVFFLASYVLVGTAALHPAMGRLSSHAVRSGRLLLPTRVFLVGVAAATIPVVLGTKGAGMTDATDLAFLTVNLGAIAALLLVFAYTLVRKAERYSLQAVAERLRMEAVVEASPTAIAVMTPEGRITMWNRAAEVVSGWRARRRGGDTTPVGPDPPRAAHPPRGARARRRARPGHGAHGGAS